MEADFSKRTNQVSSESIGPVSNTPYSASRLVVQRHTADKAGEHLDIRLDIGNKAVSFATRKGLPTQGSPVLVVRQPDHVVSYMNWEGDIPKGEYGAGKVKKDLDTPVVLKSSPDHIQFTISDGPNKGTYVFMRKDGNNWLAVKKNEMSRDWAPKPVYKEVEKSPENRKDFIPSEKLDGAHFIAKVNPNGITFTSQRKSVTGDVIAREDNVPHLRDLKLPAKYHGIVIRGELWHDKGFNTLSGILNSKPYNAVEAQSKSGLVRFAPFRVEKTRDGKQLPYSEQRKLIEDMSRELPWFFDPPKVPVGSADDFFKEVGARHGEGIILTHKDTGENLKMKHRFDYDLKIDGFTDGTGKYSGRAIGAIKLVDKTGRHVGNVGTGIDDATRIDMYKNPKKYIGKVVKVQSRKPLRGNLREPSFLGFSIDTFELDEVK